VLKALVKSIGDYREQGRCPDLIFATGDVAYSGKADEYKLAIRFFDDLLAAAGLEKQRLFVIPGNHDVDRDLREGLSGAIQKSGGFGTHAPIGACWREFPTPVCTSCSRDSEGRRRPRPKSAFW
jgi:hypothetical protein